MRTRTLRIAATLAGAAALGVGLAGTAGAAPVDQRDNGSYGYDAYGADGADGDYADRAGGYRSDRAGADDEPRTPDAVHDNLDGETESPGIHDNGLVAFDAPTIDTT